MLLTVALAAPGAVLEVELFLATGCPISNRYVPEIRRLAQQFGGQWVAWFPEPGLTENRLRQWAAEWQPAIAVKRDVGARRARRAGATVTPEAAVWVDGKLVYRGRIDDRYVSWGKTRRVVGERDLEAVLAAVAKGQVPAMKQTKAIGCVIETRY
jgi:hypothetical protein